MTTVISNTATYIKQKCHSNLAAGNKNMKLAYNLESRNASLRIYTLTKEDK